jgi:hypothetical protein
MQTLKMGLASELLIHLKSLTYLLIGLPGAG